MDGGTILALNAGSSSLKFALFRLGAGQAPATLARGELEGLGSTPRIVARDGTGRPIEAPHWPEGAAHDGDGLFEGLLAWIDHLLGANRLAAVGHRVVHGGRTFIAPTRVTPAVLDALAGLTPLAPLHQPHSLHPARAVARLRPGLDQVACFDTAFHATLPPSASRFAVAPAWEDRGVRRYGFHGLSYEWIARQLPTLSPRLAAGRTIAAHLGNGASLCALRAGRSIDTTMGFSTLDGLVMGTRPGTLDPGVLLFMLTEAGLDAAALRAELYERSGLKAVSGLSADMRTLLESDDPRAREAIDLFTFRAAREAGAMAASLRGLDGVVFTAGIGEHAAPIRAAICERLAWLGVTLADDANAAGAGARLISTPESTVEVWVVPTDEEAMIAAHTGDLLEGSGALPQAPPGPGGPGPA